MGQSFAQSYTPQPSPTGQQPMSTDMLTNRFNNLSPLRQGFMAMRAEHQGINPLQQLQNRIWHRENKAQPQTMPAVAPMQPQQDDLAQALQDILNQHQGMGG